MSELATNKRIAKNTLMLYVRMFITIGVSLYTSRVVLQTLGVSDYGIYNVVGGIITMVTFLNSAMSAASQRFLSFEMGRGNLDRLMKVFCTSVNIHASICIIALLLAETIGLWFVNTKLNIPHDRMVAANWVYQASIATFIINVMSVPYNASIVAHERMSAFAYISILDAVLKLLIVYTLLLFSIDKLILYSIFMVGVTCFIRLCYTVYCRNHFPECKFRFIIDRKLFFEMFSFAGWSIIGNMGFSLKNQISNIIINLFFGATVNAARGIAIHVSATVKTFAHNFTMALSPQITKQYAAGNLEASRKLVYAGSRYTFFLLSMLSIPLILNIDFVLRLWLGIVPEYTRWFVIFTILTSLIFTLSECVTKALQATGHIKWFQIGVSIILLSELPFAWILLELGYPPYSVMWPSLFTYSIALVFRFILIHRYVAGYNYFDYFFNVVFRSLVVFFSSYALCAFLCRGLGENFLGLIFSIVISILVVTCMVLIFGMLSTERSIVYKIIKQNIFKICRR